MAKKNHSAPKPRKAESTPKKGSPLRTSKSQPVGIDLTAQPAPGVQGARTTMRKKSDGAKASPAAVAFTPSAGYDQIAARAYMIWEAKGRPDGQDEQNWREAEDQLRREATSA